MEFEVQEQRFPYMKICMVTTFWKYNLLKFWKTLLQFRTNYSLLHRFKMNDSMSHKFQLEINVMYGFLWKGTTPNNLDAFMCGKINTECCGEVWNWITAQDFMQLNITRCQSTQICVTCVNSGIEIPLSLQCKILKYKIRWQLSMEVQDFFSLCKIYHHMC